MLRSSILFLALALVSFPAHAEGLKLSEQVRYELTNSQTMKEIGLTLPENQKFPVGIPAWYAAQIVGMLNPATDFVMAYSRISYFTTKFKVEYKGLVSEIKCSLEVTKPAHQDQIVTITGCYDGGKLRGVPGIAYENYECSNSKYMTFNGHAEAAVFTRLLK